MTIALNAASLEEAERKANERGVTLQEYLGNRTIGDFVEQFTNDENHQWLNANDSFMGDNGDFTTIREVSESSHDIVMGESISSDVSAMDVDSLDASTQQADAEEQEASPQTQAADQPAGATSSSSASGLSPRMLLGAEVPAGLLAIEDAKPEEYYQASDQIRGALDQLGEQLQQNM